MTGPVRQCPAPEVEWIGMRRGGQFVDEALDEEGGPGVGDAAPEAHRHVPVYGHETDAQVLHRIDWRVDGLDHRFVAAGVAAAW